MPPAGPSHHSHSAQGVFRPALALATADHRKSIEIARGILTARAELDIDTPFLLIDLDKVTERFELMRSLLPSARIFYAVKANSNGTLLRHLEQLGSGFDVSSALELHEIAVTLGVSPERIIYTHPLKDDRALALIKRVRPSTIVVDSVEGLDQLTQNGIPGDGYHPALLVRVQAINSNLNKFGVPWLIQDPAHPHDIDSIRVDNSKVCQIFMAAANLPVQQNFSKLGITFHVGTQTVSASKYKRMLGICRDQIIDVLAAHGIKVGIVDIGGGFPDSPTAQRNGRSQQDILRRVQACLQSPKYVPPETEIFVEPGRFLTADAGTIVTKFISHTAMRGYELPPTKQEEWGVASDRSAQNATYHRLTLNDSLFNNLAGQEHDSRQWDIVPFDLDARTHETPGDLVRCLVFGATCDGFDELRSLRPDEGYWLPAWVRTGTFALLPWAGAYTNATASEFNGFPHSDVVSFSRAGEQMRVRFDRAARRDAARLDLAEASLPIGYRR